MFRLPEHGVRVKRCLGGVLLRLGWKAGFRAQQRICAPCGVDLRSIPLLLTLVGETSMDPAFGSAFGSAFELLSVRLLQIWPSNGMDTTLPQSFNSLLLPLLPFSLLHHFVTMHTPSFRRLHPTQQRRATKRGGHETCSATSIYEAHFCMHELMDGKRFIGNGVWEQLMLPLGACMCGQRFFARS